MNVNPLNPPEKQNKSGCLPVLVFLISLIFAVLALQSVYGFWLCCGMFATVLTGGTLGGCLGLKIGNAVRRFACPELFITKSGMTEIIRLKLFWMFGPQLIGALIGWLLGLHLFLLLFWGLPITALGQVTISSASGKVASSSPFAVMKNIKNNLEFICHMSKADLKTKKEALLMVAIEANDITTAEKLIAEGVDLNTPRIPLTPDGLPYQTGGDPISPLFAALSYAFDRTEIAQRLIEHGANVNDRNEKFKGPTPLLFVLRNDVDKMIIPLLSHGASVNVTDIDGKTPLHHAANKNNETAVRMMIERGADLQAKDRFHHTPIDYASTSLKQKMLEWKHVVEKTQEK